jgi:hypothetical protein
MAGQLLDAAGQDVGLTGGIAFLEGTLVNPPSKTLLSMAGLDRKLRRAKGA